MSTTTSRAAGEILTDVTERLSLAHSLETVTAVVTQAMRELVGCDGATFVLREDDRCFYADEDAIGPMWKGQRFPMTACISGWSMLHREVAVIPDIYEDARIPHDAYRPTFVKSLCMVPIREESPIGALGSYWKSAHVPSAQEVKLLQVLASTVSVAIENLELRSAVSRRSAERDAAADRKLELERAIHTMVHDLRNPLGAMMGFAQLLEEDLPAESDHRLYARTIYESGQQLMRRIEKMLALYRVTEKAIEPRPLDLTAMAHELARTLAAQQAERRVELSIQEDLRTVADPVLTRLMLENLLANAFKYTSKKTHARIELGCSVDAQPLSTFFVRDNGDGFDPAQAHRLFRPMTRLHSDQEFPGTGLGLASVARIVELHGGSIRAEGMKSVGATFYFSLPHA